MRSLRTADNLVLALGKISWKVRSESGILEILRHRKFGSQPIIAGIEKTRWYSEQLPIDGSIDVLDIDWCNERNTEFCGFRFAYGNHHFYPHNPEYGSRVETNLIAFPHWFVITPLTLISAFLLLSKPRKSTSKKTAEPIPEKVA